MAGFLHRKKHFTSFQIIILGFTVVILTGSLLLMLPVSSRTGQVTPFSDALFTSVSAVCVTGLVVQDTATYWSIFGQSVILLLIQTGGLGVVTVIASFALLSGKKISLMQRSTMQEAIAAPGVGGIVRLTNFILKGTFAIEFAGAMIMLPVFCRDFGLRGIWMAFFHSISAFCNAGFDILGTTNAPYASLTAYTKSPVINLTVMSLIIVGGIGFLTWDDIRTHKLRLKKYKMQSKVILVTTAALILLPAIFFYFAEFSTLPFKERFFGSLFQSVTPRTAGFNTLDLGKITSAGQAVMIALMLVGGSPGSTAGGMKTTTLAVLLANALAVFRRKEDAQLFGRRIEENAIRNASTVLMMYITLFFGGALIINAAEGLPLRVCLFETASAAGTVGLTLGVTPGLGLLSRYVLILLMFFGRVGGLTLIFAALSRTSKNLSRLPQGRITVG
ncbi:MAG: Trk family potassium uptake protein [Lachnospiraceae bacterium]|nr:Trk family potassium uptake protein [Lachnospiraceae bacterium]